jgi:hypothetical protein
VSNAAGDMENPTRFAAKRIITLLFFLFGARISMDARSHIHYAQTRTSSLELQPTLGEANA